MAPVSALAARAAAPQKLEMTKIFRIYASLEFATASGPYGRTAKATLFACFPSANGQAAAGSGTAAGRKPGQRARATNQGHRQGKRFWARTRAISNDARCRWPSMQRAGLASD